MKIITRVPFTAAVVLFSLFSRHGTDDHYLPLPGRIVNKLLPGLFASTRLCREPGQRFRGGDALLALNSTSGAVINENLVEPESDRHGGDAGR